MTPFLLILIEFYTGFVALVGSVIACYLSVIFWKRGNSFRQGLFWLCLGTGIACAAQVADSVHFIVSGDFLIGAWRGPVTFTVLTIGLFLVYSYLQKGKGND